MTQKHHHHTHQCATTKKIKNLTALVVLLSGVVVGALFVDIAQLIAQKGFSSKALQEAQVISYDDATWVRYDEPRVIVDVIVSDDCGAPCDLQDDLLLQLRRFIPTLEAHRINLSRGDGQYTFYKEHITHLPAFVFDSSVQDTAFYREASVLFDTMPNQKLLLRTQDLDMERYERQRNSSTKETLVKE